MSIFSIKSLQSLRSANKADPIADLKDTGHEKRSRTPIFVGASIAALVMYMKTAHAAAVQGGQAPMPVQDDHDDEGQSSPDSGVVQATSQAEGAPLASSRRMWPAGQDADGLDSPVRSLGEWGWEITGSSSIRIDFGAGASAMMSGVRVLGSIANDNGMARPSKGHHGVGKAHPARSASGLEGSAKPNRAPTISGPVLLDGGFSAMAVLFTLDDLLAGAVDPDKDAMHVVNVEASSGTVIPVDGGYVYIGDETGPVTLTYYITDGYTVTQQQASFTVTEHEATVGTSLADTIVGGDGGELIESGPGNDTIHGGAAMDTIYAGDGNDEIHGGGGNDVIVGGSGNDNIFGDDGNDLVFAGAGNDLVQGGLGNDRLYGGTGNDMVFGDAGNDMVFGDAGDDILSDGAGEDHVEGGEGDDVVVAAPDGEADTFDGGAGSDALSYAESEQAVVINIAKGTVRGADAGADTFQNFETFVGGQGDDTIITGSQSVTLYGGEGEDDFVITVAGIDATAPVRHVLEDFEVGDHVRMSNYDMFEDADVPPDFLDQMRAQANGEAPDSAVPIQIRYDDESHNTYIEADFDQDGVCEASVEIDGYHLLQLQHHSFA